MNFEAKDWLIMIIPIILEGILIFFFQTYINRRFVKVEKKMAIKENVVHSFLVKIMDIRLKYETIFHSGKEVSEKETQEFLNLIFATLNYFKANEKDLVKFKEEFYLYYNSWTDFVDIWNMHAGQVVNNKLVNKIKNQLDICEENTDNLIRKIREKGL